MTTETNTTARNSKGELGTGTPSSRMKSKWHKDKTSRQSFKQYLRAQAKSGVQDAKDCLANKSGQNDAKPSEAKLERIASAKFGGKKS
jgi:hypothetical protein